MDTYRFFYPARYAHMTHRFFSAYEMEAYVVCPLELQHLTKPKHERVCRFCGKKHPETTFKNKPHLYPELLGNRYALSEFECDTCNHLLSKYENDLATFLSVTRSINGVRAKTKIPTYKSIDNNMRINASPSPIDSSFTQITVLREASANKTISVDVDKGDLLLTFKIPPYIPLNVYKAFLKMALTTVTDAQIANYPLAIQYLMTNSLDAEIIGVNKIFSYTLPLAYTAKVPVGMLFKKKDSAFELFTHVFVLHFQNMIYQLVLPLHSEDIHFGNGKPIEQIFCPPLGTDEKIAGELQSLEILQHLLDLSSPTLERDGTNVMNLSIADLEGLAITPSNVSQIVEFQFSRKNN